MKLTGGGRAGSRGAKSVHTTLEQPIIDPKARYILIFFALSYRKILDKPPNKLSGHPPAPLMVLHTNHLNTKELVCSKLLVDMLVSQS